MDGYAGVLIRVLPILRGYGVFLTGHWLSRPDVAVLKHHRRIAEDEVHRAVNVAFPVELP